MLQQRCSIILSLVYEHKHALLFCLLVSVTSPDFTEVLFYVHTIHIYTKFSCCTLILLRSSVLLELVLCNTYLMIQDQCIYLLLFRSGLECSTFPVLHLTNCADAMVLFSDLKNIVFFFAICTADTQFIAYPKLQGSAVVNRWAWEARCNRGCTFTKGNEIEATVLFYCRGQNV